MAFDIRAIFSRALGGRRFRDGMTAVSEPGSDAEDDGDNPVSPISAAFASAAAPDTDDMSQGGASTATALIPEGLEAMPSASADTTHGSRDDDAVSSEQAQMVAEAAISAAMVHGDLSDAEAVDLLESLREIPGLETMEQEDVDELIESVAERAGDRDAAAFVDAMEDRLDEIAQALTDPVLRRAAYQLAVYFCAHDGVVSDEEADLLTAMSEAFEIADREARWLREATLIEAGPEGAEQPGG